MAIEPEDALDAAACTAEAAAACSPDRSQHHSDREWHNSGPGASAPQPPRIVRVERLDDRQNWLTYSNNWY